MANRPDYKVEKYGSQFSVTHQVDGLAEYDLINDEQEARDICSILNRGIGPEWDDVEPELEKVRKRRARRTRSPK